MQFIKKLKTLITLKPRQLLLLPIMLILLGIIRIIILTTSFARITKIFLYSQEKNYFFTPAKLQLALDFGKSIAIAAKYTPWASTCLTQGLLVRLCCRLCKIPNIFYIGVSYNETGKFLSHAWVNVQDVTIVGGKTSFDKFKIIKQFEDVE
jgi:hypothetical protein